MDTLPQSMKAAVFDKHGDFSVLRLDEQHPLPTVNETDVLVKVHYAGVNFVDIYQRSGLYPVKLPLQVGREGAGTIVKIGCKVPPSYGIQVGDRVAVFTQGTTAEYVSAPSESVMVLPPLVSIRQGAALMLQGLTAWTIVQDAHKVEQGEMILIQAAAGGTGGMLVQMCKHLGATVIGTVSTPNKADIAKKHGCDHIILYKDNDVQEEVMKLTGNKGCHAVLSGVGEATFPQDLACTRRKGTLVSYGNSSGAVSSFRVLDLSKRNVKLVRPTLANYITERDEFVLRSQQLLDLVGSGVVRPEFGGEYRLEEVGKAQDDLTTQKTTGKLLIRIQTEQ
ncbi:quinone oxidoreductase family protein [Aspergillus puulaauensis]|uniref:Probable quinone oxidoreductase n=1 Tax=Aspergillus puulaauensis TaxID=1220207 RepID=A0A7R7XIA8_9EURO|nr:putative secondary metabolism biosynthetic enzyme [Aspergillus puulaauensis]BCS21784.1 putative secondary metabolism biosynthetic enzyme [Aspergillus puulaauensis]